MIYGKASYILKRIFNFPWVKVIRIVEIKIVIRICQHNKLVRIYILIKYKLKLILFLHC